MRRYSRWGAEVVNLTPNLEFEPPKMALDSFSIGQIEPNKAVHPQSQPGPTPDDHDITCVCAKCNDPKFAAGGTITADRILASEILSLGERYVQGTTGRTQLARTFIWARQRKALEPGVVATQSEDFGKVNNVSASAFEVMDGPATYDDGRRFVVLETILDLEYTIFDTETDKAVQTVPLSLGDAIRICDEWNVVTAPAFSPDRDIIRRSIDKPLDGLRFWMVMLCIVALMMTVGIGAFELMGLIF